MKEFIVTVVPTKNPAILKFELIIFITKIIIRKFQKYRRRAKKLTFGQQYFNRHLLKRFTFQATSLVLKNLDIVEWDGRKR